MILSVIPFESVNELLYNMRILKKEKVLKIFTIFDQFYFNETLKMTIVIITGSVMWVMLMAQI